jgi:hypothetical protein
LFSNLVQLKYEEGAARLATPSHFIKQPGDLIFHVDDEEQEKKPSLTRKAFFCVFPMFCNTWFEM